MDPLALAAGNILLGNDEGAAGIEIPVFPFQRALHARLRVRRHRRRCARALDDVPLLPWWARRRGRAGAAARPAPAGARRASRAYLCLAGGVDVPEVLGSRSTQLRGAFGGLEGRAAAAGRHAARGAAGRARAHAASAWCRRRSPCRCEVDGVPRRARAAGGRIRRLQRGLARRVLVRRMEDHARRATATATGWPASRWRPTRRWRCARTASCPA